MIKIHIFNNLTVANGAAAYVNEAEGYPREGCETLAHCCVQETDGIIYIQADQVTELHLGPATEYDFS
jgi:hypothetical protein